MKAGANRLELNVRALLTNWKLALGLTLYLISTVFYVKGIAHGEISVLFPAGITRLYLDRNLVQGFLRRIHDSSEVCWIGTDLDRLRFTRVGPR